MIAERARRNRVPILYVNLVGGQDGVVVDGGSFVVVHDAHTPLKHTLPPRGTYLGPLIFS